MEEENSFRKVECLRGRLLAERVASRNAKQQAQIMGNKMIELETKLKEETKSRNKAEKKLKFLIKKLESNNILYSISDEISLINSQDRECQESVGSTKSSYENVGNNCSDLCCSDSPKMLSCSCRNLKKCTAFEGFDTHSEILLKNSSNIASAEEHCAKSSELEFSKSDGNRRSQVQVLKTTSDRNARLKSSVKMEEQVDFQADNSLALVPMDQPKKIKQTIDPIVLDDTVREVLDALRHAKEKLQTQMERRKMIKAS
ncbi:putative protein isoform X1 [Capsicum annuum]|uniref:uncharacterized protein LOC107842162 isoform X1 n=1 Tax=Capsicum annuum TaxID=4072 RepID=UPI001FB1940F|nr:uncharacterized protein LOC107842162 isoform X1 [Capsicum annuum]